MLWTLGRVLNQKKPSCGRGTHKLVNRKREWLTRRLPAFTSRELAVEITLVRERRI
jgi:hypothetical protein